MIPWILAGILQALILTDVLTTTIGVQLFGGFEANPVMATIIGNYWLFLAVKTAFLGTVLYFAAKADSITKHGSVAVLSTACICTAIPAASNLLGIIYLV